MTTFVTISEIMDDVADIISVDRPVGITSSTKQTDKVLLALAHQVGEELNRRGEWPNQIRTQAVTATTSFAVLASDFQRLVAGGAVMDSGTPPTFIRGATSSDQWRLITNTASAQPYYFLSGGFIRFYPDTSANGAEYTYISDQWVTDNFGANKTKFTADDDKPLFRGGLFIKGLVWRWRRNKGLEYTDELAEFEADLETELKAIKGLTV